MALLIAGTVLWLITHLFPAIAPGTRKALINGLGINPYKGLFAVDIVIALALIIMGWKSAIPSALYAPAFGPGTVPSALMFLALLFLATSSLPNNLRRHVRHPQMTAVICWGIAHLLTNGDSRSVVLFGGMTLWAVLEIIFINKRDGEWQKPAPVSHASDLLTGVVAIVAFAGLAYFHARLFGVAVIPA
jgi:uncharacterized membrane protein